MTVYIYDEDALEKIIQVEGELFRKERATSGNYSFEAFLEEWKSMFKENPSIKDCEGEFVHVEESTTIYGFWGYDRYGVLLTGEIVFNEGFAICQEKIQEAKDSGFRIW